MKPAFLVTLCACNQFYGLDPTELPSKDAAVTTCPPLGTAPKFGIAPRQVVQQNCSSYHFNAAGSLAAALCDGFPGRLLVGNRDGELVAVPGIPANTATLRLDHPRPAAEGGRLYAVQYTTQYSIVAFDETSPGVWAKMPAALPISITGTQRISTMFRGATGDRFFLHDANGLVEYEQDGTAWPIRGMRRLPTNFGGTAVFAVTTNGLRAVFVSFSEMKQRLFYVERPDIGSDFGEPHLLEGAPMVLEAQLTEDCARLYYDGLDSIFYSPQI